MLLPVVLVLMLLLINRRSLMGRHVNGPVVNLVAWISVIVVAALTLLSTAQAIFPSLGS